MKNKILERRRALEASLHTVRYQIKHLQNCHSREQIRAWFRLRNSLVRQIAALPTPEQVKADAVRHTAFVKSIIHRK